VVGARVHAVPTHPTNRHDDRPFQSGYASIIADSRKQYFFTVSPVAIGRIRILLERRSLFDLQLCLLDQAFPAVEVIRDELREALGAAGSEIDAVVREAILHLLLREEFLHDGV
jgi:hypothetical protein